MQNDFRIRPSARRRARPVIRIRNFSLGFILLLTGLAVPASAEGQNSPWGNGAWAQTGSDIPADPAVQFGTLPNGMRYAIMKNATPSGQASLRLRIGSGSLHETDEQQGLAHFLEHMAFKGSTHVPEGEMVKILQRKGLAFGPDTNAATGFAETVYQLDLPKTDADTVQTGLMLMREVASELTLSESAMNSERGVILAEERDRDTPQYRASTALFGQIWEGQLAARRLPLGKTDVIRNAPVSQIRDFYQANYRPERTTLIVVGDIAPAEIETQITARFADWKAAVPARPQPDLGMVGSRKLAVKAVETPGSAPQMHMNWARPYDTRPATAAREREQLVKLLALSVFNRRLGEAVNRQNPPFLSATAAYTSNQSRSSETTSITATFNPGGERGALAALEKEQRQLVLHGVTRQEMARESSLFRTFFENLKAGASTRQTPDLAATLIGCVNNDDVCTSPERDLARVDEIVGALTVEEVNSAIRDLFSGSGPLVLVASPSLGATAEADLTAEYTRSQAAPVAAPVEEAEKPWPYASFGAPGEAVERQEISEYGVTFVRFANGVRLSVMPTRHQASQILVSVRIGDGKLSFPKDSPVNGWSSPVLVNGGLKALTAQEVDKILVSKQANITVSLDEDSLRLGGATRSQDLDVQLQLLTAYITDPAYRAEDFERARDQMQSVLTQVEATANGVWSRDLAGLLHRDDKRWRNPTREVLATARADDVKATFDPLLTKGAIEIAIVGAVTVEDAIRVTASTLGALPKRPDPRPVTDDPGVKFPETQAEPVVLRHKGRPDDAIAFVAWPTTDWYADTQKSRALGVAVEVLKDRLEEQFRQKEGAAYSVDGVSTMSFSFPGYGYAWMRTQTQPEKTADFQAAVSEIAADLRAGRITDDQLARAKEPQVEGYRTALQTNEFLLGVVSGAQRDPRQLKLMRSGEEIARVTARDVQDAASRYLTDERMWKLVVLPSPDAVATSGQPVVK